MIPPVKKVYNINYTYYDANKYHPMGEHPELKMRLVTTTLNDNITLDSRMDEPSYVLYDRQGNITMEAWHRLGFMHRLDGPAWITYNKNTVISRGWYYNGDNIQPLIDQGLVRITDSGAIPPDSVFTLELMENT